MYKTKKYGVVSCKTENQILAELERDLTKKRKNKTIFKRTDSEGKINEILSSKT
ncbi:hypothetical protein [Lactobacillus helveticus]|uniref:hypothetical protein n=1 Tax=Lactobacillus helveticus TaxID=1587 RepID=UPI001562A982|nr:hypothetical protein [Lactobacillus helveticus]NRN84094.1 hypothetical protein [Lactobacillus helveticus]NRN98882.1 hypothetical protein [Lactobacillus helveticus]